MFIVFILLLVFTLVGKPLKGMRKILHTIYTDRNASMAMEWFPKVGQLYDLPSARLHIIVELPDVLFQTILHLLDILATT